MNKVLIVLILISTSLCLFRKNEKYADEGNYSKESGKNLDAVEQLKGSVKNQCTNGKDPKSLSTKEYLEEFARGPCSPMVVIPGLAGSNLRIEIHDCNLLQKMRPQVFQKCGWWHCQRPFPGSPAYELKSWVPDVVSPISLVIPDENVRACFDGLMGLELATDSSGKVTSREVPGVRVVPEGHTASTKARKNSNCGATGFDQIKGNAYMQYLIETMDSAGYISGLTAQYLPYDWRQSVEDGELTSKILSIIEDLNGLTGKRVNIAAHSLGNYVALDLFWHMSQEQKDNLIREYFMVASPTLGAPLANNVALGGMEDLSIDVKLFRVGINFEMAKTTVLHYPPVYQLTVQNTFKTCANQKWLEKVKQRIQDEESGRDIQRKDSILSILPKVNEECTHGFNMGQKGCRLGIHEFYEFGSIMGETMTPETYPELLKKYSFERESILYETSVKSDRFDRLENPGVKITNIFANHVNAITSVVYEEDPRIKTSKGEYAVPEFKFSSGDGIVPTSSAVIPAFKWMQDYVDRKQGAKRVHLAHLCGDFDIRPKSEDGRGDDIKYYGIDCNCKPTESDETVDGRGCGHMQLFKDAGLISFLLESSLGAEHGNISGKFRAMTEEQLKNYSDMCRLWVRE